MIPYDERQQIWEWCREFIDREGFYRVDDKHPPIPGRGGGEYHWQGYSRRAAFNPHFAHKLGRLFWDHFQPVYECQPFQVCACVPSGPPIGMAISTTARRLGINLNLFLARRESKLGLDNWFDGVVLPKLPVLIVDDTAGSAEFMRLASARIQTKLGLPLHRNYFAVTNKVGRRFGKHAQHTENYLDNELISLFTMNNFCLTVRAFEDKYGQAPQWTGFVG